MAEDQSGVSLPSIAGRYIWTYMFLFGALAMSSTLMSAVLQGYQQIEAGIFPSATPRLSEMRMIQIFSSEGSVFAGWLVSYFTYRHLNVKGTRLDWRYTSLSRDGSVLAAAIIGLACMLPYAFTNARVFVRIWSAGTSLGTFIGGFVFLAGTCSWLLVACLLIWASWSEVKFTVGTSPSSTIRLQTELSVATIVSITLFYFIPPLFTSLVF